MTILLIEDNRLFSELIEASLDEADVHVVDTLGKAQAWLRTLKADLILIDLGLPDSSGLNTLKALNWVKTPKVVLTAASTSVAEVAKLGAVDFIPKGDARDIVDRIQFNMSRLHKRRTRFAPDVFQQIRACFERESEQLNVLELTPA